MSSPGSQPLKSLTLLKIVLFFLLLFSIIYIADITTFEEPTKLFIPRPVLLDPMQDRPYLVNTRGCKIPQMNAYDPTIIEYLEGDDPVICDVNRTGTLVKSNLSSLYLDLDVLNRLNLSPNSVDCCFREFWRKQYDPKDLEEVKPKSLDTTHVYSKQCIPFELSVSIKREEFVRVECKYMLDNRSLTYYDFFLFAHNNYTGSPEVGNSTKKVSVLVLGMDAISRLNFHRQMPLTNQWLRDHTQFVEFVGYNKVDDNTFPNLVPVLGGVTENELMNICWPSSDDVFDSCPFVWKNFSDAGFITGLGEDAVWMGLFNYQKVGFWKQPTDYYLQIFQYVAENELGHEKRMNAMLCVGARLALEVLYDSVWKIVNSVKDQLSFLFFWGNSLSHDFLNLPRYGDQFHVDFLSSLKEAGVFNTSLVVLMSDHGIRWGGIRSTYQGYLEERLPLLLISYPPWFKDSYPEAVSNLQQNKFMLTTPFDLHETLMDLTSIDRLRPAEIKARETYLRASKTLPRGISLFLPISTSRTCQQANISDHWCTCHQDQPLPKNDSNVILAASKVVEHINSLLVTSPQCAPLKLHKIISARAEISAAHVVQGVRAEKGEYKNLVLTLETVPGNGQFEATLQRDMVAYYDDSKKESFKVTGSVSRINQYGSQSYCTTSYKLKLYCFCKDQSGALRVPPWATLGS